jgi:hypothetical protein
VQLKGWNHAHEIRSRGQHVHTICDNVWLKNDKDMHAVMDDLLCVLKT